MTIDELIKKRQKQLADIVEKNLPLKRAVATVEAERVQRIFIRGENSSGGQIGQYDTTHPLYVNPDKSPKKFPVKGKTGETKFKSGKPHKTGFFDSYKSFRSKIGRKVDFVNLSLSNDLQSDLSSTKIAGGFATHNPEKINQHEYHVTLKRPANVAKMSGLEKKYGSITKLIEKEKKLFHDTIATELKLILAA